jgi:hypothetical protein
MYSNDVLSYVMIGITTVVLAIVTLLEDNEEKEVISDEEKEVISDEEPIVVGGNKSPSKKQKNLLKNFY